MAIILKSLSGDEIPLEHRRTGLEVLFAVEDSEGRVRYLESDVDAARLVTKLSEQEKTENS
jgi:hypothetical protein